MASVENQQGCLFFLNRPGGTGKTYVYNTLCYKIHSEGWIVLCVASSGITALLLQGGHTVHSMFKIPIEGLTDKSFCSIPKESLLAKMICQTRLIIWDEATMQHQFAFEAVDRTCHDVHNNKDCPFGSITVFFGGDYQQILPVVIKGSQEAIIGATLQHSYLWPDINLLCLWQNKRLEHSEHNDKACEFANWLLDTGHGCNLSPDETISSHNTCNVTIPPN